MGLVESAVRLSAFLTDHEVPHALIGGLALQHWGEARLTRDVDCVVLLSEEDLDRFYKNLMKYYRPRIEDALDFAKVHRILLLADEDGTPVDLSLGLPGYEEEAIARSVPILLMGQGPVNVLAAEDLVIHKCVAGRPRDIDDLHGILVRQKDHLNIGRIRDWLKRFRSLVESHDVEELFELVLERVRMGGES